MAEEEFISDSAEERALVKGLRDSIAAEKSGEEFLRGEEEEPEVVELPQNVDRVQAKQAQLQQEINVCQSQINELASQMETAQLAFQQCVVLSQVEERLNGT